MGRGHSTPSLKISCKSAQPFSRNLADKEIKINKEINKETKGGVINRSTCDSDLDYLQLENVKFHRNFSTALLSTKVWSNLKRKYFR